MKSEKTIQDEIRVALSEHGLVFRTNAGEFWQGKLVFSKEFNQRVLINLRMVDGLPEGFSDLLFVGPGYVAFIETKTETGKTTPEQDNFLELMRRKEHMSGVARSVEDAIRIIGRQSL